MKEPIKCSECGNPKASVYLRPFAGDPYNRPARWVCDDCDRKNPATVQVAANGGPRITMHTIARADRLAHQGAGWSVDHVLQQALALLEQDTASRERRVS